MCTAAVQHGWEVLGLLLAGCNAGQCDLQAAHAARRAAGLQDVLLQVPQAGLRHHCLCCASCSTVRTT